MNNWDEQTQSVLNELLELLRSKHNDYGDKNLIEFGLFGILVRCNDKMERLKHLANKDPSVINETVRDTWMDLAGYAIQAIVLFMKKQENNYKEI